MSHPDAGAAWSHWPAPAKLNLFLQIVGRRDDGMHLLQTVFQLLDWGDEIALRVRSDGCVMRSAGLDSVNSEEDLVVRAARALQFASGSRLGAEIAVTKRIPVGGGFGGGSSDAATVLVALDRLWGLDMGLEQLARIALTLGADVPVFVHGRSAWAEGIGERLQPLDLPRRWFLLLDSGVSVPTAELFQSPDLTREARSAKIADFVSGKLRGNAFEPVLVRRAPEVARALEWLGQFGAASLTGTGGGTFAAFEHPDRAREALAALPPGWRAWVAEGVNESPLHRKIAALSG